VLSLLPVTFQNLAAFSELSLVGWRELFAVVGWPDGLSDDAELSHAAIFTAVVKLDHLSPDLLDGLEVVMEVGTDTGRDAVLEAAVDQSLDVTGWSEVDSPRELALRLWIGSRTDEQYAQVLVRSRLHVRERPAERAFREFAGKRAHRPTAFDVPSLVSTISAWCASNRRGEGVQVVAYERDDERHFEVLHGHLLRTQLEMKEGRPAILKYRPGHADHVRYAPDTGRLSISTRSMTMLALYCRVFGEVIAGDATFFASERICSLGPLQRDGTRALEKHSVGGILRVNLVELLWVRSDRDKMWVRSRDCFRFLNELRVKPTEGRLVEAKLEIYFAGGGRPAVVTVKVPNRLEYRAGKHEGLVEQYLREVGIQGIFREGVSSDDLWSLSPWRHSESVWRQLIGRDFDRLRRADLFTGIRLVSSEHPDHPEVIAALEGHALNETEIYGISTDEAISARSLTPSDTEGFELRIDELARKVAAELGLTGTIREVSDGIWDLGRRELDGAVTVAPFLIAREPGPALERDVRAAAGPSARLILLVPRGRAINRSVPELQIPLPSGPFAGVLRGIVEVLELRAHVSAPMLARPGARLVVDKQHGQVFLDGHRMERLVAGTHPHKFVTALIEAKGGTVLNGQLKAHISPAGDSSVVKQAKKDALDRLARSFEALEVDPPSDLDSIFVSAGGGYCLKIACDLV
jgi:hypothetical protein